MIAKGTFEVSMKADPPYDVADGVSLGHVRLEKRFSGELDATSEVHMIGARTAIETSAGYVAIERIQGSLAGKSGSFVMQHNGTMTRGAMSLSVTVVPDSGTGGLTGIAGKMSIDIIDGKHFYTLDATFPA